MYKRILNTALLLCFALFIIAQGNVENDFSFDIHIENKPLSINRSNLTTAISLVDINRHYKDSWVKEYKSISITTIHDGKVLVSTGKNNILTSDQKSNMSNADYGSDIVVDIQYIPNNSLPFNDEKTEKFTFIVNPDQDASYTGGEVEMKKYLREKIISKIDKSVFTEYKLAAIKFTITEDGEVANVKVAYTSEDLSIDKVLIDGISNMSLWSPAAYADGSKTSQNFVLTVGNMKSCNVNSLNIAASKLPIE